MGTSNLCFGKTSGLYVRVFHTPYHLFYIVKQGFTGVYIICFIFALKHRLWVLVRTASVINVLSKNKKNIIFKFSSENYDFYSREILLYIAWACLRNDMRKIYQNYSYENLHFCTNLYIRCILHSSMLPQCVLRNLRLMIFF